MAEPNFFDQFDAQPRQPSLKERSLEAGISQSGASTEKTAEDAATERALRPYRVRREAAEATKAEQLAAKGPTPTDADTRKEGAADRASIVRAQILAGIDMYRKNIEGQPLSRGFGYLEKMDQPTMFGLIPAIPEYEQFTAHNNSILPLIRPLVAQTAKEGDSDKEMQVFQSYIPTSDDSDRAIETKYAALSALIDGMTDGKPPSEIIKGGLKPRSVDVVERDILRRLVPQANDPTGRISPIQSREAAYDIAGSGDPRVVASADQEITGKLQQALDRGAPYEEIQTLASNLYGGRAKLNESELKKAIAYRDNFLRGGGRGPSGATVYPRERPMTAQERKDAQSAESADTSFFMNLGNALTLNTAPDIAGMMNPSDEANIRSSLATVREASPNAAFMGSAVGSIAPAMLLTRGLSAVPGVSAPAAALAADTGSGAVMGAAESPDNRFGGAAMGAALGTLGALAGRYAVDPIAQSALDTFTKRAPKPSFAQTAIGRRIGEPLDALTRLTEAERLGLPMGLADTTTEAQALAGRVARKSPAGADIAETVYPARQLGRPDRAAEAVERDVTAPVVLRDREESIKHQAYTAASPWYDKAFSRPAPVNNKRLQTLLNTPAGRDAMRTAYDQVANEGSDPLAMGFAQNADGTVTLAKGLSWETLDKIRDGVAANLDTYRDNVTRKLNLTNNRPAQSLQTYLHRLTTYLDEVNPDYKQARSVYESEVAPVNYLRLGLDAADPKTKVADVERILSDISRMPAGKQAPVLQAFREGFATRAADQIASRPQGADAYAAVFGSPAQQRKLALIGVTPEDFAAQTGLEQRMAKTAAETRTQPMQQGRSAADDTLDSSHVMQGIIETGLSGAPLLTGTSLANNVARNRGLWHGLRERYANAAQGMTSARAGELAPTLMGTDPGEGIQAIMGAQSAINARNAAVSGPRALSTLVGGSAAQGITGSQSEGVPMPLSISADLPRPGESEEDRRLRDLLRRYNMTLPGVDPGFARGGRVSIGDLAKRYGC